MWLVSVAAQFVGTRGAVGLAAGAALAAVPSFHLGRWTEAVAAEERVGRVLAENDIKRLGAENARVDAALAARLAADRRFGGSGLSDDGFRRD